MAAKGDDGETDSLEEVGEADQHGKNKKRNLVYAIRKAPRKIANVMSKKKMAPRDCGSKEEDPKPRSAYGRGFSFDYH